MQVTNLNGAIKKITVGGTDYSLTGSSFMGTTAEWASSSYVPQHGEIVIYNDNGDIQFKIGDGTKTVGNLTFVEMGEDVDLTGYLKSNNWIISENTSFSTLATNGASISTDLQGGLSVSGKSGAHYLQLSGNGVQLVSSRVVIGTAYSSNDSTAGVRISNPLVGKSVLTARADVTNFGTSTIATEIFGKTTTVRGGEAQANRLILTETDASLVSDNGTISLKTGSGPTPFTVKPEEIKAKVLNGSIYLNAFAAVAEAELFISPTGVYVSKGKLLNQVDYKADGSTGSIVNYEYATKKYVDDKVASGGSGTSYISRSTVENCFILGTEVM